MNANNVWVKARQVSIQTPPGVAGNFNIGFDKQIPETTKAELRRFVAWVEEHFYLPVTLWVDFEYRHYLITRSGKRVGYLFYWSDFSPYPLLKDADDIPIIRLPVRTEDYTMEEILLSFIEAITCYFAWLLNLPVSGYTPDQEDTEEILQAYMSDMLSR